MVFELASIYNALAGFSECNHEIIKQFQGYDYETAQTFWRKFLMAYLETTCAHKLREVEDKARIVGYTRLIRRSIRRGGLDSEASLREIDHWKGELLELLERTDTLLFSRNELEVEAISENLAEVQTFLEERLGEAGCPPKTLMQINVAVEEIFINIASYAYAPETGNAVVRVEVTKDPAVVTITFSDRGKPYDPTAREDPDISLSADDRPIGGLGVFLTKKIMDEASYEFKDGQNILTLKKKF